MDELSDALERLYERFAAPAPRTIDGCPCCVARKTSGVLHSTPLRSLSSDALGPYAASVFLTVGSTSDFRYFLPRILEVSATEHGWWPSPEVVLGKLKLADWAHWDPKDRRVVEVFLSAWWDRLLRDADEHPYLEEFMCGLGRAGIDASPFLQRLTGFPEAMSVLREYSLWQPWENASPLPKNPFWKDCPEAGLAFASFLRSSP